MKNLFILALCLKAIQATSTWTHNKLLKWDVIRYVESDYDPKTGEERIWHVYDKGEKPAEKTK